MTEELSFWCERMLPRIREISPAAAALYSADRNLEHYRAVSEHLEQLFRDPVLARAGFLHGIGAASLEHALPGLDAEVLSILRMRDSLASLQVDSPAVQQFEQSVLPKLPDSRPALLLVREQLHHIDPAGRLEDWVASFHVSPTELPPELPLAPLYINPARRVPYPTFLRAVVAPVARHFGLWHEHTVLEDAVLLTEAAERFRTVMYFALAPATRAACEWAVEAVRRAVGSDGVVDVRWEWRHIASMSRRLPRGEWDSGGQPDRGNGADWRANLHQCGMVTVLCSADPDCYAVLGRLHGKLRHRDRAVRDLLQSATASGYRAIHTEVTFQPSGAPFTSAMVRLLPAALDRSRFMRSEGEHFCVGPKSPQARTGEDSIEVFAPDGRALLLPPGSSVLNFAYKLRNSLPAFVRDAQVNREWAPLLHRLKPGDVVWLNIGTEARPLPKGWEHEVPASTVDSIAKSFRRAFRDRLRKAGRLLLQEYLVGQGVGELNDEETDRVAEAVAKALADGLPEAHSPQKRKGKAWWYFQLGLGDAVKRGELVGRGRDLSSLLDLFLNRVAAEVLLQKRLAELRSGEREYTSRLCGSCNPKNGDSALVFAMKGSVLVLHRSGAQCAGVDALPVERHFPPPQYVTVIGGDRPGLAAEMLSVFHEHGLGIVQIDGLRLGRGSGLVRVQLDPVASDRMAEVLAALRRIPGVQEVAGPQDRPPAEESRHLARRRTAALAHSRPIPYVAGPAVIEDARFYGMQAVLDNLQRDFDRAADTVAPHGVQVLVHGPKRVGKSSVVLRFLRQLDERAPVIPGYVEAIEDDSWSHFESRIVRKLVDASRAMAEMLGGSLPEGWPGTLPAVELVGEIRNRFGIPVVLAVDEAVFLMEAVRKEGKLRELRRFAGKLRAMPGVLTVWIGPSASRRVMSNLAALFQTAREEVVPSLSRDEVGALLRAEKFGQGYLVKVNDVVIERAHAITGGNPFWLTILASRMWEKCRPISDDTGFDDSLLRKVLPDVVADPRAFLDRYHHSHMPKRRRLLVGAVLQRLAGVPWTPASADPPVVTWEGLVAAAAAVLGHPPDANELADVVEELRWRGTLATDGEQGWRLAAPLLAAHLAFASRGNPQWLLDQR